MNTLVYPARLQILLLRYELSDSSAAPVLLTMVLIGC